MAMYDFAINGILYLWAERERQSVVDKINAQTPGKMEESV